MSLLTAVAQMKIKPSDIDYVPGTVDATGKHAMLMITDTIYFWAGVVAVVVLIVASLLFVTSKGDAAQMKRAKDAIRGAVIGLVVVILAFVITQFVIGGLQG